VHTQLPASHINPSNAIFKILNAKRSVEFCILLYFQFSQNSTGGYMRDSVWDCEHCRVVRVHTQLPVSHINPPNAIFKILNEKRSVGFCILLFFQFSQNSTGGYMRDSVCNCEHCRVVRVHTQLPASHINPSNAIFKILNAKASVCFRILLYFQFSQNSTGGYMRDSVWDCEHCTVVRVHTQLPVSHINPSNAIFKILNEKASVDFYILLYFQFSQNSTGGYMRDSVWDCEHYMVMQVHAQLPASHINSPNAIFKILNAKGSVGVCILPHFQFSQNSTGGASSVGDDKES